MPPPFVFVSHVKPSLSQGLAFLLLFVLVREGISHAGFFKELYHSVCSYPICISFSLLIETVELASI